MSSGATATSSSTLPSRLPDLPASIVLLCLYLLCAIGMIFRLRQSHMKFRVGAFLIGLCMSRVVTFSLRAAWAENPTNKNLAIAATVFLNAGVILLVVVNMQLFFRMTKSLRPELQQSRLFVKGTIYLQSFIIPLLIMTIVPAIQSILTNDRTTKSRDSIVLKISSVYIAFYACLPAILAPLVLFALKPSSRSIARNVHYKAALIALVSTLVGLELCLRCANNYVPRALAGWYGTRASFYVFTPMLELLSIITLLAVDLPHAFGDSNQSVLDIINGRANDKIDQGSKETTLREALQATTTTWKSGMWTIVE